jgi:hypothetical protein
MMLQPLADRDERQRRLLSIVCAVNPYLVYTAAFHDLPLQQWHVGWHPPMFVEVVPAAPQASIGHGPPRLCSIRAGCQFRNYPQPRGSIRRRRVARCHAEPRTNAERERGLGRFVAIEPFSDGTHEHVHVCRLSKVVIHLIPNCQQLRPATFSTSSAEGPSVPLRFVGSDRLLAGGKHLVYAGHPYL